MISYGPNRVREARAISTPIGGLYARVNSAKAETASTKELAQTRQPNNGRIVGNPYLIALRQRLPVTREESLKVPGVTTTMGCE